ncbi:hemolysin III family protein [Cellulophaga sp. E16_2]|uniref:PAQR family membrane homeostasis protein TrhA n=1 Tax=Cellulophaga sp. E16_2 TaxID=2789297 RepID=UPI001A92A9E6|nr:hemolysin III family protein [Cellulophaga sp. E16_2]MBO0592264.1 hemolysin III family protein [Cellulophaga sp. E16_2]
MDEISNYKKEELLNTISHGIGVVLGLVGFFLLLDKNSNKSDYAVLAISIYSFSIVLLYTASTLYHAVVLPNLKKKLRVIDHISIYFLIAGTYSPVALITLVNGNGWTLFAVVWSIALLGTILKLFFTGRFELISLLLYLVMGWLIVFDFQNLVDATSPLGINLLMIGGGFYTIGILFYAIRKIPYNHAIWHLFVLGGSISHWLFIYLDVI